MPKSTVSTPIPPLSRPRAWPKPDTIISRGPPYSPPTNQPTVPLKTPRGGGGNP